jgi:hypothetical protein
VTHFYLGTHQPGWLSRFDVPFCVSHGRLRDYKTLPKALGRYMADSRGFTELKQHGTWTITPEQYVAAVARYDAEIGHMDWAAPQDWMCEPEILANTGLTAEEHCRRTVDNFVRLERLWPEFSDDENPFMPTLQGGTPDLYRLCARMYADAGIDLRNYETVALGSVCRIQATSKLAPILDAVLEIDEDLPLHGFGVKLDGLRRYGKYFASADSLSWSFNARQDKILLPGCTTHINCANCPIWALQWRDKVLELAA